MSEDTRTETDAARTFVDSWMGGLLRTIQYRDAIGHAMIELVQKCSDDYYCALWSQGIEHELWDDAHSDDPGRTALALRALSEITDAWVRWEGDGPVVVSLDTWRRLHAAWEINQETMRERFAARDHTL